MTLRVWIDTDVGSDVDDALAIAYALRHPEIELVGISTVFGDVDLRTRIARALLGLADASEVPVVSGLGAPLTPGRIGRMFGHEGIGVFDDAAPALETQTNPDAEARIARLAAVLDAASPDALVAIGPMTNLGALARSGHALPALTIMGGKIADVLVGGMIPQIPEWNWWCDPEAVASVLAAAHSTPPRIVPAEVTFRTLLAADQWARLASGDALARQLHVLCEQWIVAQKDRFGSQQPCVRLHDPLAVVAVVDSGHSEFTPMRIRIDSTGTTTVDPNGAAVEIAGDANNAALCAHLLDVWLGAPAVP